MPVGLGHDDDGAVFDLWQYSIERDLRFGKDAAQFFTLIFEAAAQRVLCRLLPLPPRQPGDLLVGMTGETQHLGLPLVLAVDLVQGSFGSGASFAVSGAGCAKALPWLMRPLPACGGFVPAGGPAGRRSALGMTGCGNATCWPSGFTVGGFFSALMPCTGASLSAAFRLFCRGRGKCPIS